MVAICPSRARPSPPNDVSRTNGRQRMVGSTQSVVIGSLLGGRSDLVSRFRRRPQPRHRRNRPPVRVSKSSREKACSQALAAEEGISRGVARSAGLVSHERGNNKPLVLTVHNSRSQPGTLKSDFLWLGAPTRTSSRAAKVP
jgi:hypothetical protein